MSKDINEYELTIKIRIKTDLEDEEKIKEKVSKRVPQLEKVQSLKYMLKLYNSCEVLKVDDN